MTKILKTVKIYNKLFNWKEKWSIWELKQLIIWRNCLIWLIEKRWVKMPCNSKNMNMNSLISNSSTITIMKCANFKLKLAKNSNLSHNSRSLLELKGIIYLRDKIISRLDNINLHYKIIIKRDIKLIYMVLRREKKTGIIHLSIIKDLNSTILMRMIIIILIICRN